MDQGVNTPLVEGGLEEEEGLSGGAEGTFGGQTPVSNLPNQENVAEDETVRELIARELVPAVLWTRTTRMALEEEWRAIRRMEMLMHDDGRKYMGRSDAYIPIFSRNAQTLTSRLARGLFPTDDYMDVAVRGGGDPETAKPLKTFLQWEFEENARLRNVMKPFLRQLVNYGNAVLKMWYRNEIRREGGTTAKFDVAKLIRADAGFSKTLNKGLAMSARSIFSFYIHPVTAASLEEATLCFEDIMVSRGYAKDMIRKKLWLNGEAALHAPLIPNLTVDMADQITNTTGISDPSLNSLGGSDIGQILPLTECWTYLRLPKRLYAEDEDPEEAVPVRVLLSGSVPVEVRRNGMFHQRPPYLVGRLNVQPGLFYGYGFGRPGRALQYLTNDFANQTNDAGAYALNPINKVNPGAIAGPLRPLAPGVTWYLTDVVSGQKFEHPPIELIGAGLEMVKTYSGMAQDYGGVPPMIQGIGSTGGAAKTATGGQILQQNAMQPLQDIIEDLEHQVMIPMMNMAVKLAQQYVTDDVIARVAGEPFTLRPADLALDMTFRWLASSQAANSQQRAQAGMQLIQEVMPLVQYLQSIGYQVDPVAIIRRVYADGLGYRGFADFIRKLPPPQMAPQGLAGGMPAPGGQPPGQPAQPPGNRVRSAVEQTPGGSVGDDMQEGEGGEFMNIRRSADALSRAAGASRGGR